MKILPALFMVTLALPGVILAAGEVERGKYLVEEVAKCQDCHTPRGSDGQLDQTKWLKGAVLDFQPLQPMKEWHKTSPDLTPGSRLWQRWGEKGLTEFLKTGLVRAGTPQIRPCLPTSSAATMPE